MTANKRMTASKKVPGHILVFLIDDHPPIREAIRGRLQSIMDIDIAGEADTAEQGLHQIEKLRPDVVVTDISQKDGHGLDLVENIKSRFEDVQVVVYSRYEEIVYAERVIRAGASGYVMKTSATDVLVDAIRTAHGGEVYLSRKMSSRILSQISRGEPAKRSFTIDELTDRELTVFQMLGEGYGMTEIQDRLSLSRKTIETYRRRAKDKLGLGSVSKLLQYALQWVSAGGDERLRETKGRYFKDERTLEEENTPREDGAEEAKSQRKTKSQRKRAETRQ
ncbi:response regulator transcription factor [Salinibacter ruber]|jgi:DNA-binding NarL/FixJ family response regulator|uniref:response regulator transcription factor n=1 Tax=Salinibacter ruber TaxID=146919 RepID=UPI00311AB0B9